MKTPHTPLWLEAAATLLGPIILAAVIVLGAEATAGARLPILPVYLGVILAQFAMILVRSRRQQAVAR